MGAGPILAIVLFVAAWGIAVWGFYARKLSPAWAIAAIVAGIALLYVSALVFALTY
ncbi:hypothetical protein MM440_00035 [Arsenicicoccus piscis]|uniref:Uncharacterized protein n=1 Tax=Arsenicicoccus piscis TaxID=673954 RepID=A0ABQ6HR21_9MICO|nr:hypothetical protein [Arsenicicoccus piscis]MCH8626220.1 hypothetical protein [Arsenicicoccus piscis]GMA20811.1 hypothetical protein GCM10025862_28320 [Arsenicicoccus piscis]